MPVNDPRLHIYLSEAALDAIRASAGKTDWAALIAVRTRHGATDAFETLRKEVPALDRCLRQAEYARLRSKEGATVDVVIVAGEHDLTRLRGYRVDLIAGLHPWDARPLLRRSSPQDVPTDRA